VLTLEARVFAGDRPAWPQRRVLQWSSAIHEHGAECPVWSTAGSQAVKCFLGRPFSHTRAAKRDFIHRKPFLPRGQDSGRRLAGGHPAVRPTPRSGVNAPIFLGSLPLCVGQAPFFGGKVFDISGLLAW